MKQTFKAIGIIATMGIMIICAYLLGTTQSRTVLEVKEVEKVVETIPDGYIPLEELETDFLDMATVIGYSGTDQGLQLYTDDGCGYYLEVEMMD